MGHNWPANTVRELRNVIERAVILARNGPEVRAGQPARLSILKANYAQT